MELLAILFAEFLMIFLAPIFAALALTVQLVVALIITIGDAILSLFLQREKSTTKKQKRWKTPPISFPKPGKWFRRITITLTLLAFVLISTIYIINQFFFEDAVRFASKRIKAGSEMNIQFTSASGSLFTGKINLENIKVKHTNKKAKFDLHAKQVELQFDLRSAFSRTRRFEKAHIDGITGSIVSLKKTKKLQPGKRHIKDKIKLKRHFVIEDLQLTNVDVSFGRLNQKPIFLKLTSIKSKPFTSRYAIFNTFFRSNITGTINGKPFDIATKKVSGGRETKLNIKDFPIADLGEYIQKAPIHWFKSGSVDIQAKDIWKNESDTEINMKWRFILKDPYIEVPEDINRVSKKLVNIAANYINNKDEDVDISFGLVMDKDQFKGTSSLDAAGLWKAVFDGFAKQLSDKIKVPADKIKKGTKKIFGGFKNFLDRRRKNRKQEE